MSTRKPRRGLVHHSDRGSPYASEDYRRELKRLGIRASMSRRGDRWDNSVAESFFSSLKAELTDGVQFATLGHAEAAIKEYIENFYNPVRRHSYLNYCIRIGFELKSRLAGFAA